MPPWLRLALVITIVCTPGIVLMAVRGLRSLRSIAGHDPELPRPALLVTASVVQNLIGVAALAAAGCWALPRAGLDVPFFRALATGGDVAAAAREQLIPGLGGAAVTAAIVLPLYYRWARRTIDVHALARIEHLRVELGLLTRVSFAGVSEEVLFRLGVLTLLAWAFGGGTAGLVGAVSLSSLVFAAAHLPALVAAGVKLDRTLVGGTLALNAIAGLIFGLLFWRVGLLAAMIAHAGFHALWWPFERRFQTVAPPRAGFEWIGEGRIGET